MEGQEIDSKEILRLRARALARRPAEIAAPETLLEVLVFELGDETYAIQSGFVREVQRVKDLTPLPCTPPFLLGIVNIRGRIVPVVQLKRLFDLPDPGLIPESRLLIVSGNGLEVGLIADDVVGLSAIPLESIQPPLPTLTGIRGDYLRGVTAERLIVLDLAKLLGDPKLIVHKEVEV